MKNFMKLFLLTIVSASLFLSACNEEPKSKLLGEKISEDNIVELADKIEADPLMDYQEIGILVAGMTRIGTKKLVGMTVGEVIKNQEEYAREKMNADLFSKSNSMRMTLIQRMQFKTLQAFQNKEDEKTYFAISFSIENLGEKDIKRMAGALTFMNAQGQVVKTFNSQLTQEVPAGKSVPMTITSAYDPNNQIDPILLQLYTSKQVSISWKPVYIEFADETKLMMKREVKK
jgi:hypothetical protein